MSANAEKETMEFQTEAKQLLQLMIHSLYSNKEIFLRELVSNGSDACDKLRFEAISEENLWEGDTDLAIQIEFDKEAKTISISDNGIGMSRDEVISNIGTIAKSGTKEFLGSLTGDQKQDSQMIGQFGVGFYSSFIVADKVEVITRRAGIEKNQAVHWISEGEGSFTIEACEKESRGTQVILHIRDDENEFLEHYRISSVVKKYSDHISLPIQMLKQAEPAVPMDDDAKKNEADKKEDIIDVPEWEAINDSTALWTRSKSDIKAEEYNEFYKSISYDFEEPLAHLHSHVEGNQSYKTLFYVPKRAPFDLWDREKRTGIKLYVKRVYILDDAEHLMPNYLRFIKGVVDSDDLPLNVSREILQSNPLVDRIRSGSVKKILGLLEKMAKNDKEKYQEFWDQFGRVMKEGPAEDNGNKEAIAKLLRFSSTQKNSEKATTSLEEYVARMKPDQKSIYYVTADSFSAAKNSPHLEIFNKKEIEVILMHDRVDEWMMSYLQEFDGKSFKSVSKGQIDSDELADKEEKEEAEKAQEELKHVLEKMKKTLGDRVKEVRVSHRLTNSPSCLVVDDGEMAINLQNILKQAGQDVPGVSPIMEVNANHILVKRLNQETDQKKLEEWTHILFDQALLSEGGQLDDPAQFVGRLNDMFAGFANTQ